MADAKISELPAATTPLAGTEPLPIVQGGETRGLEVDEIAVLGILERKVSLWSAHGAGVTNAFNNANPGTLLWNFNPTTTGTAAGRSVSNTSRYTRTRRLGFTTGTGSTCGVRGLLTQYASEAYRAVFIFGVASLPSSGDWNLLAGMISQQVFASDLPSGSSPAGYGVRRESDGWKIISSNGTTRTVHATLSTTDFPVSTAAVDLFKLRLDVPSGGATVNWSMTNLTTGVTASGTISSTLPAAGTGLAASIGGTSVNANVGFGIDASQIALVEMVP